MTIWGSAQTVAVEGADLAVYDSGGVRPPVVMLHGLGGHAREWDHLAALLAPDHRLVAFDQRGHGDSTRAPADTGRDAYVADVAAVIAALELPAVTLVGQSMGAHTALLAAAAHPARVARLVLVEGGVGGEGRTATDEVIGWFRSWPVPFADHAAAVAHFGGGTVGEAWAAGLATTPTGLVPRFDIGVLEDAIGAVHEQTRWEEWRRITAPTLLVKGAGGFLPATEVTRMLRENPRAGVVEVPGAGHDVHLDAPDAVARAIREVGEGRPA